MSALSAGSVIALAWLRPRQCLSKRSRLQRYLLVEFVVSCHSSPASGMLNLCQIVESLAFHDIHIFI